METNKDNKKLRVAWREINGKIYNLLLLHSAPDVIVKLGNHVDWDTAESGSNAIMLLDMLRDITHNLKEIKQGVMAPVERHVDMTYTHQKASETLEEYFRIFIARISSVNAHGGNSGYQKVLYNKHLVALKEERGITATTLSGMSSNDDRDLMKELDETAMESS